MKGKELYVPYLSVVTSVIFVAGLFLVGGCQQPANQKPEDIGHTLTVSAGADLQRQTEVELVEKMARFRNQYQQHLELLRDFYDQQGNHLKAQWAAQELNNLVHGPKHSYLVVAEIAGPDLRATDAIIEADLLYQEARQLYNEGKGGLGGLFTDEKKLYQAIEKFNGLITRYPSSDKIDDAAYHIAQIYHQNLKDYHKALLYYQRVWQWDANTPYPARYYVARIYDEQLHDLVKALEFYHRSVNLEKADSTKVEYAKSRIEAINKELSR